MKFKRVISVLSFITFMVCIFMLFTTMFNSVFIEDKPIINYETSTSEQMLRAIEEDRVISVIKSNGQVFYDDGKTYYKLTDYDVSMDNVLKLKGFLPQTVESTSKGTSVITIILVSSIVVIVMFIVVIMFIGSMAEKATKELNLVNQKDSPTKKHNIVTEKPNVTFDDVSGCKELKKGVQNDIECLKNPELLKEIGARMPKGIVLYGPPGTGKTLIAKAIAGTAGVPFISASGSDFIEMYVGVGAQRIRQLYAKARSSAPCIVFIDEIDAIGAKRGMSQNSERDQTINALLTELDGFAGSEGILTICATNRLDMLDPALIRAGRFDKHLAVLLPDKNDRLAILKKHANNKKLSSDINLELISEKTIGFSGADLEGLLNESALLAISQKNKYITKDNLENAFFKIVMKGDKKENVRNELENKLIAYHEAGHALATKLLTDDDVPSVTIIGSTSGAGGVTFRSPKEKVVHSKKYLRNLVKVMYAGRAAEYILLKTDDEITTGASQDIKQATRLIKDYLGVYGMGQNGMIAMEEFQNTDTQMLSEASSIAKELYDETIELLEKYSYTLEKIANALIKKETIDGDELESIVHPKIEAMDFETETFGEKEAV